MKVRSIKYNLIRKLNLGIHPDFNIRDGLEAYIDQMPQIELSDDINIFIGRNGSGKSTIIDLVRSLVKLDILPSLPRENPPTNFTPGFFLEFSDGLDVTAILSAATFDPNIPGLDHIGCMMFSRIRNVIQDGGFREDFHKYENDQDRFIHLRPIPLDLQIHYKYCGNLEERCDHPFVNELNLIQAHLEGILDRNNQVANDQLPEPDTTDAFAIGRDLLQIYFEDEIRFTNRIPANLLPAGWKSFAEITSWLNGLPDQSICLLEEPEVHLHPDLQRLLMKRIIELSAAKDLQLLISTHSHVLMNTSSDHEVKIFNTKDGGINDTANALTIIDDLGCKASDILQSNCVIWVEGPSDRIYINYWLRNRDPELIEGEHYSIMFFGGSSFSHLTTLDPNDEDDDETANGFIELQKINRKMVMVFDSDKSSSRDGISQTKNRLIEEFNNEEEDNGLIWVTDGREIENYILPRKIRRAISKVHPSAHVFTRHTPWRNLLKYWTVADGARTASKVKVAKEYSMGQMTDIEFDRLSLGDRTDSLILYIRQANGI